MEVIEHLYSPRTFAAFVRSILEANGGGRFILTTPYHGYLKNLSIALAGKADRHYSALWEGGHIKFWSRRTLAILLREAGFRNMAFTGAVRDAIMDVETLACHLMELLAQRKPEALTARFKIVPEAGMSGWDLLEAGGRKRGFLISGGEVDLERMANILLDEFRGGKLGRITLELPQDLEGEADHGGTP